MTEQHTPEPWTVGTPPPNGERTIGDDKGLMVAVATTGYGVSSEANARRIVACVNALKNVSTEWLEAQNGIVCLGSPIKDRFLELEKQRDDLLAALEYVIKDLEFRSNLKRGNEIGVVDIGNSAYRQAKAALARVKGGAA